MIMIMTSVTTYCLHNTDKDDCNDGSGDDAGGEKEDVSMEAV